MLRRKHTLAFTLVETLVSVGVVMVLAAVGVGAYQTVQKKGRLTREVSAGRNLMTAYQLNAADNDGRLLPGMDYTVKSVWYEPYGKNITVMHLPNRYPYRLAPYFGSKMEGTILVNDNAKQIAEKFPAGNSMYDYAVSAFPAFGINYNFVGGCVSSDGSLSIPDAEVANTLAKATPSILAFASAGTGSGNDRFDGYNILTPPQLKAPNWSNAKWSKDLDPGNFGNVDARHDGRAVCVYLDGSVRLQSIEELRDMRLWSRNAAEADNPNYTVTW